MRRDEVLSHLKAAEPETRAFGVGTLCLFGSVARDEASAGPADLHAAHGYSEKSLKRIYNDRRLRNDADRLKGLFELYTTMTVGQREKPKCRKMAR